MTLMAMPRAAHFLTCITADTDTDLRKPIRRRSIRPAPPIRSASPMKCNVSQIGQMNCDVRIASETGVAFSQTTSASLTVLRLLDVGHPAAGPDCPDPEHQRRRSDCFHARTGGTSVHLPPVQSPFERNHQGDSNGDHDQLPHKDGGGALRG